MSKISEASGKAVSGTLSAFSRSMQFLGDTLSIGLGSCVGVAEGVGVLAANKVAHTRMGALYSVTRITAKYTLVGKYTADSTVEQVEDNTLDIANHTLGRQQERHVVVDATVEQLATA